jgi:cyclopropane-fatty-acyl-phospholipid synthase
MYYMPESRHKSYAKGVDFIRKYIFPGGYLPSTSQLVETIKSGSEGTLIMERMENIGGHYAKTLRLWRQNFLQNFDSRIRPVMMSEHEEMREKEVEVFRRKWEVRTYVSPYNNRMLIFANTISHIVKPDLPPRHWVI